MNRKVLLVRILSVLLMTFMVATMVINPVLASTEGAVPTTTTLDPKQFNGKGDTSGASGAAQNIIGAIISIAQVIGVGVAIIMLIVLAIKYISAAPSEKAEIKKTVIIYVTGAIILFAASGILQIIKQFAGNIPEVT